MRIPQSTIRLLTGRLVKSLLSREVSTMKSNTQNAKIKAITEKSSIRRSRLSLVTQRPGS